MFIRDVLDYFDISIPSLATALNVSKPAVYQWKENEPIPEIHALRLAAVTNNELRYDPELYGFKSEKLRAIVSVKAGEKEEHY